MKLDKLLPLIVVISTSVFSSTSRESIYGGPNGNHPFLRKTLSSKEYVHTARNYNWSINYHKPVNDTINIVALRVEFNNGNSDKLASTTGPGIFGKTISDFADDKEEREYYEDDTSYIFDRLPHDSLYFAHQLDALAAYYKKVSRNRLTLTYKIYPSKDKAYAVDSTMLYYSPGGKKKKETWDEFYYRSSLRYMFFIKDALTEISRDRESPFTGIRFEKSDNTFRDSLNRKTVFLIFHAGASGLTDGLKDGYQDTPADITDGFVTAEWFKDYADTLKIEQNGILVDGKEGKLLIDEIMVCSETSNQDGVNWGIQGILVNQLARQLGIPDLYSTFSGTVGVGAFCIMDFAGYSAGTGFVPPYPSAWVRAFMGWDEPKVVPVGAGVSVNVKALTSILDNPNASPSDTTIVMIPINDHEYYLIENRQRNLSGTTAFFNYDSTDGDEIEVIRAYPENVNLKKAVSATNDLSKVVRSVNNNDISLPASGILVWHIDEKVIREKIKNNFINADSAYRGVRLVEADGADDIGVKFYNYLSQEAYDYGTGEDVFPHRRTTSATAEKQSTIDVTGFGPFTFPSTRTNDGGHSYLSLKFKGITPRLQTEKSALYRGSDLVYVENFSDSVFTITASIEYSPQYWPKTMIPESYYEPVLCDLDKQTPGKELFVISKSGRINIFNDSAESYISSYPFDSTQLSKNDLLGNTGSNVSTCYFTDSIDGAFTMPSVCNNAVMIPSVNNKIHVLSSVSPSVAPSISEIPLKAQPSSYLCVGHDSVWAIGCSNGSVIFGKSFDTTSSVKLSSDSSVCAVAVIRESGLFAVIQTDGALSVCGPDGSIIAKTTNIQGIAPYTLATGDLDRDSTSEIVISDIKHGLWLYRSDLSLAKDWSETANDQSNYYTIDENNKPISNRTKYPDNPAPPALADFNGDGHLDIIIGGTNGLYAFNYKGVLLNGWPSFLDKKYWYQKGSVVSSPAIVTGKDNKPVALFATTTGDKVTFGISKVVRAERNAGKIWYTAESGMLDSIWDLRPSEIDTILQYSDSLILPYVLPGGYIDAVAARGTTTKPQRPMITMNGYLQSIWPLSAGSPLQTSPMIADMDLDGIPDVIAITKNGWAYRWKVGGEFLLDTLYWPMPGFDQGRSFAYGSYKPVQKGVQAEPVRLYNYPNPTDGAGKTVFRYSFSGKATKVRLDIFSITGVNVYSKSTMGSAPADLTGSYPDWNEHLVSLKKFGPGVYRCRMEATINSKKHVRYWKMAVVK